MNLVADSTNRSKALIDATRPFAAEQPLRSYAALASALALGASFATAAVLAPWWPVRALASVGEGLIIVRLFIIYHDFMHGAILRDSLLARSVLYAFGLSILVPPRIWRQSHNYHHAHTAQIVGSGIGSFPMVTKSMWERMSPRARLHYRVARHPLTIAAGYVTIFMFGMCLRSFVRSPRKYWDSAVALLVNWTLTLVLVTNAGMPTALFSYLLPLAIACALGAYLFYAQHNFPAMRVKPREEWSYVEAALTSSSYLPMGRWMQWVTGNIGFHHVHHLNPSIPFYRLPEAMRAIPELQHPGTTTLAPRDVATCFRGNLWDTDSGTLVDYASSR
jgi:omega-6 fatty acid desaturase (delta-12 desaturase)